MSTQMSEKEYRLKNDYPEPYLTKELREKLYAIDEKKRAQMRKYYDKTKTKQNMEKIILRAKNNPDYCPQEGTLEKYDWSPEQKAYLSRCMEERKLKFAVPRPRPIRVQTTTQTAASNTTTTQITATTTPSTNTLPSSPGQKDIISRDEIFEILDKDTNITEATKKQWKNVVNNFVKVFSLQASKWTDVYTKYTNQEILEMLNTAYQNETTRIKQVQLTPKLYNTNNEDLMKIIGLERYNFFDLQAKILQRSIQAGKINKKLSDTTDYVDDFINVFKKELELRKSKPSSMDHLIAMLYSIGMYSKQDLSKESLSFTPRIDYDNVKLVKSDNKMTDENANYYNFNNGHMRIHDLKTGNSFKIDYIINPLVQKYINDSIKDKNNPREYLLETNTKSPRPFTASALGKKMTSILGIGNQTFRKMTENIYSKIFKVDIVKLSEVAAHEPNTAYTQYLNSLEYTEDDREAALKKIQVEVENSAS